jgi:hypothetical protein
VDPPASIRTTDWLGHRDMARIAKSPTQRYRAGTAFGALFALVAKEKPT